MRAIFAAAATGRTAAREQLFAERFDGVFVFLRMALADPVVAERGAVEVLVTAVERHVECPNSHAEVDVWLRGIALEQLASRARYQASVAPNTALRRAGAARLATVLAGVSDDTLGALVRALDPITRQVVVLGHMARIDHVTVATIMGIDPADVAARGRRGLAEIARLLEAYDRETQEIGLRARENAYHLRPHKGPTSDGMIVVQGTRAMVDRGPGSGFVYMALRVLARLFEKFMRHHHHGLLDDDVGETLRNPVPVKRTATDRSFDRPERTPSLTEYQMPRATPGTPTYREPKGTPSTARISSPRHRGRASAAAFGGMRKKF